MDLQKTLELLVTYFPDKVFSDALNQSYNQLLDRGANSQDNAARATV
jgi:hypothetical protein